jgi:NAD(P)-dependent dehydrogenase (short-subunit alcohol dehydrogenase family)
MLSSLRSNCNVAVIGASGGIGNAFVQTLASDDNVGDIYAFSRAPIRFGAKNLYGRPLDLTDETSIEAAADAATANSPLDLVIVSSGILHRDSEIRPEKSMREIDPKSLAEVLAVNAIGPALVAKHFLPKLRKGHKTVFAALSARVGSIGDNRLGGWASYRMSKAALNMLLKTASIEQARNRPESIVVALHPGTVQTALSQPFTRRVEPPKLFSPAHSAGKLLQVIDSLGPDDSGGFFAYDRSSVDF